MRKTVEHHVTRPVYIDNPGRANPELRDVCSLEGVRREVCVCACVRVCVCVCARKRSESTSDASDRPFKQILVRKRSESTS